MVGCGSTVTAQQQAVTDLDCPLDEIESVELGSWAGSGSSNLYQETGCGGLGFYVCTDNLGLTGGSSCGLITEEPTQVAGQVMVDRVAFVPAGPDVCETGYSDGFFGVEIDDGTGDSIHLIQDPVDGSTSAVYVDAAGTSSPSFASCVDLHLTKHMEPATTATPLLAGTANLACSAGSRTITGLLTFHECGVNVSSIFDPPAPTIRNW